MSDKFKTECVKDFDGLGLKAGDIAEVEFVGGCVLINDACLTTLDVARQHFNLVKKVEEIEEDMKNLYEFHWDCGRQGEIGGRFFATANEVDSIIGREINFGEVLGKHSDIYGELLKDEITLITDNQEFLQEALRLGINLESGYSPLEYYDGEY